MVSVAVSYLHAAHPHGMIVKRQVSAWQRPLSPRRQMLPGAFLYMLIKSVDDLIRAFVVAACNQLVTAVAVENQHVNHPPVHLLDLVPNL